MSQEARPENPQQIPSLGVLVEDAYQRFQSQRSYPSEFRTNEPYLDSCAASDTLSALGAKPAELLTAITGQASVRPDDIKIDIEVGLYETWDEFYTHLSAAIVAAELCKAHPEIKDEIDARMTFLEP